MQTVKNEKTRQNRVGRIVNGTGKTERISKMTPDVRRESCASKTKAKFDADEKQQSPLKKSILLKSNVDRFDENIQL